MTEVEASPPDNITYVSSYFGEVMAASLPPYNLVLFCDNPTTERFVYEQRRARDLEDQTVIVRLPPQPLTDSHIAQMEENRMIWVPCKGTRSPRECVLGFARYELMLRVLDENPFESEYFAWVEGAKNTTTATVIPEPPTPNKISCECRGYVPPAITSRWHRFFAPETKSDEVLSLDWFSGDPRTMRRFCHAVLEKFRNCLSAGFGNFRDSQVAYLVYRDHPDWFDLRFPDNLAATAAQQATQDWDFLRAMFRSKMKFPKSHDPRSAIFHPTINPEIFERFVRTEIMKAAVGGFPQLGNDGLKNNLYGRPGYMPYHLLGYISGLFREKKLLVVGGENAYDAALALCTNPANTVVAADATDSKIPTPLHRPRNLEPAPADLLLQPEKFWESHIHAAAVIFLEGSPRTQPRSFFDFLRSRRFQGLVILNGVYVAAGIAGLLQELEFADWSEYGSYTGTIAIRFAGVTP